MVRYPPEKLTETPMTEDDVNAWLEKQAALARKYFLFFRHFLRPQLIPCWWQQDVAWHLQQFWYDLQAGKRPALVLQAPPQHGKTEQVMDFVAWCAGMNPNLKTIFGSYSEDLGVRVNMNLQRIYDSDRFKRVFGKTQINDTNVSSDAGRWMRNSSILEYVGHEGSFRNTTVMGQINGMGLDLGVIDDPMKGRAEASSKTIRDKTWNWFTDDFFGRFSNNAGFLMIEEDLKTFCMMMARAMPLQVENRVMETKEKVVYKSIDEVNRELASRGMSMDVMFKLMRTQPIDERFDGELMDDQR
jgi:hypothetical protein